MHSKLIDIRGLNYRFKTGINTVNLHVLYLIHQLKLKQINYLGLSSVRSKELGDEFKWFNKLIQSKLSGSDFLNKPQLSHEKASRRMVLDFYFNKELKDQKYDLIYQTQPKPLPIPRDSRFITTFHDLSVILNVNQRSKLSRNSFLENKFTYTKLAKRADKIIANSYSTAFDLVKYLNIPESKIEVVYWSLPDWTSLTANNESKLLSNNLVRSPQDIHSGLHRNNYFIAISGFEFRKNFHNLIQAWKLFQSRYPHIAKDKYLVIAGSLVDHNYFHHLLKLKQSQQIHNLILITEINQSDKELLLKNCICLIYPSLYEGFGFPILEANKFGKGVITSFNSSMPEISGKTGFLVNPLILDQIADALYLYLTDARLRFELESETKHNLSRFSWNEYQLKLEGILR